MRLTQHRAPTIDEPCRPERYYPNGFFEPPRELVEGPHAGRLIAELRNPLRDHMGDPSALLVESAIRFAGAGSSALELAKANALADLAVTGEAMFNAFVASPPRDAAVLAAVHATARVGGRSEPEVSRAVDMALDRAYRVAYVLRGWTERNYPIAFGWLAVSGEDDSPHRPVNVPGPSLDGTPVFQYDLRVSVPRTAQSHAKAVRTRYILAGHVPPPPAPELTLARALQQRVPPPVAVRPVIPPTAKIVLYVHGLDSRAEECLEVAAALVEQGFTVLSMDMPNFGYATKFRHQDIADPPQAGRHNIDVGPYGALAFLEAFIVAFIDALDSEQSISVRDRIVAVVGGSLGGNMGLRLAQRGLATERWLHTVVAWSPGSTWGPSWERFRHADGPHNIEKAVPVDTTRDRMLAEETTTARRQFFEDKYLPPVASGPRELITESRYGGSTAGHSFRDGWQPCKANLIAGGRRERQELYHEFVRQWHWRVAHEQLVFMHVEPSERPRYQSILSRVLLGAGLEDDYLPEHLYINTRQLSVFMANTPGHAMWLEDTGHSIHNERPRELARAIASFAPPPRPSPSQVEEWSPLLSLGGESLRPRSLAVATLRDGRLVLFGVDQAERRIRYRRPNLRNNWLAGGGWRTLSEEADVPGGVPFGDRLVVLPLDGGQLRLYAMRTDQNWLVHFTQRQDSDDWDQTDLGNHLRQLIGDVADVSGVERVGAMVTGQSLRAPLRVHVLAARLRSNRLLVRGQTSVPWPNGYWNEQPNFGSTEMVGLPLIARDARDQLHLFGRRADNQLVALRREGAERDQWSRRYLEDVGTLPASADLASCLDATGRLRLFVRALDGSLHTISQLEPGGSAWGSVWQRVGGAMAPGSRAAVTRNAWGDLQVFIRNADNELVTRREVPGVGWQGWQTLADGLTSDPVVGSNQDGTITVFALRASSIPWFRTQTSVPRG